MKLVMASFKLFKSIVPLCMLTDRGSHTELLIIMDVYAKRATSGL